MLRMLMAAFTLAMVAGSARADIWNFMIDRYRVSSGTLSASQFNDEKAGAEKVKLVAAEPGATIGVQATVIGTTVTNNLPAATVYAASKSMVGSMGSTPFTANQTAVAVVIPSTATSLRVAVQGTSTGFVYCYLMTSGAASESLMNTMVNPACPYVIDSLKLSATGGTLYLDTVADPGSTLGTVTWGIAPATW